MCEDNWRVRLLWESFSYYDEPRTYYDKEKKEIVFIGEKKRKYTKKKKKED